jgi:CheY-like chemotaxis protein
MLDRKIEILLVEDNPIYVKLLEHAFGEVFSLPFQFRHLIDGESAVRYLNSLTRKPMMEKYGLPAFVLLDLNLPGKKGIEVLAEVRSSVFFDDMPIIVLSSSENQEEIDKCMELGAHAYYVKPIDYEKLEQLVEEIQGFSSTLV